MLLIFKKIIFYNINFCTYWTSSWFIIIIF